MRIVLGLLALVLFVYLACADMEQGTRRRIAV